MGPENNAAIIVSIQTRADTSVVMTDQQLLQKFADNRDQSAFAELVSRHGGMVCATARRLVDDEADDVAQAVFLLFCQRAASLGHHRNLAGWLYETTRRCSANRLRQRRRYRENILAARESAVSSPSNDHSELLENLDAGLATLSNSCKRVLLMRYMENRSVEETAGQLGLSTAAVMKRSTRGLSQLRKFFNRHGTNTSVPSISAALLAQAMRMSPVEQQLLAITAPGNASPAAVRMASATRLPAAIGGAWSAVAVAICIIAGLAAGARWMKLDGRVLRLVATPPAAVTQPAPPAVVSPPLQHASANDDAAAANGFLKALGEGDAEAVAGYLPPGDDQQTRALAKTCVDTYRNRLYAQFPERLQLGDGRTIITDADHHQLNICDVLPPIDAVTSHLELTVAPVNGHYYVAKVVYTEADSIFTASTAFSDSDGAEADNNKRTVSDRFDYTPAAKSFQTFLALIQNINTDNPKPDDIPKLVPAIDRVSKALTDFADALKGGDITVSREDLKVFQDAVDQSNAALKDKGAAGLKLVQDRMSKDPQGQAAGNRIMAAGFQAVARAASGAGNATTSTAAATKARPVSIEPERKIHGPQSAYTIPGALKFPAWLRSTAKFRQWQFQHKLEDFTVRDDAGDIYLVVAVGAVKNGDGTISEIINEIRMYRPDRTLAETTRFDITGMPSGWTVMDSTGTKKLWDVGQGISHNLYVTRYSTDGSEDLYDVKPDGTIERQATANAIGAMKRYGTVK